MTSAQIAIRQCYAVLNMDTSPARHEWKRGILEAQDVCERRRRAMLAEVGASAWYASRVWDELPQGVRNKLAGVAA